MAFNEVNVIAVRRLIDRQLCARKRIRTVKFIVTSTHDLQRGRVGKIEAVPQINNGADDEWLGDASTWVRRMFSKKLRPFTGALGAILPEIGTFAKPIVAILTDSYVLVIPQDPLTDFSVAAVVAENKRGRKH